jgi:NitT/TauT family transport system substrate-binding protein
MRSSIKGIAAAVAILALGFVIAASAAPEKKKVTIGLPVTTSTFLPLYLAEQEGFFKTEGVDVQIVAFRGGTDLVRGLVAGAVDIAVGAFAEALVGIESGQRIKVFYGGFNMAVFDWYAVPRIKSFDQVKGARFGVTTFGSSTDFLTRYALATRGLDPERDVKIIQGGGSGPRMAAMEAGQLDVNIFATPEKFVAADRGYNLILRQTDLAEDYPFHVFYARQSLIDKNPDTIRSVLRGFVKGVRLAKADKDRSVKLLVEKIGLNAAYAVRGYDEFIGKIYEDGRLPSEAGMKAFWEMGIRNGTYKEPWPKNRYWVGTFHDTFNEWKPK